MHGVHDGDEGYRQTRINESHGSLQALASCIDIHIDTDNRVVRVQKLEIFHA